MKKKSPAFQYYPKDILADTAHLSPLEDRAYRRILDHAMVGIAGCPQGRVPNDDEVLARLAGFSLSQWRRIEGAVRAMYKLVDGGQFLESKRIRKEIAKQQAFLKEQKRKSRLGNDAKRRKKKEAKGLHDVPAGTVRGTPRGSPNAPSSSALASKDLDQKRTSYGRAREAGETVDNSPPPHEERGEKNGAVKPRPRGTDLITPPVRSELAWYGDEDRWRKVERAVRILWTNPTACREMLVEACTVPKARRDRVNESADDTLAKQRAGDLDPTIARRDLIAAIKGSSRLVTAGREP